MEQSEDSHTTTTKKMKAKKRSICDYTAFKHLESYYRIRLIFVVAALRPTCKQI